MGRGSRRGGREGGGAVCYCHSIGVLYRGVGMFKKREILGGGVCVGYTL